MDYLTLNDIIEHTLPATDVEVPEWGGKIEVRALTGAEMDRCERQATNPKTGTLRKIELMARIVEAGCVQPKFAPGQYKMLMTREPGPLARLVERISTLSGVESEPTPCTCPACGETFAVDSDGELVDSGEA